MLKDENGIPRRSRLDLCEPSELAIYNATQEVEKVGADERLTKAVNLLSEARNLVADYLDEKKSAANAATSVDPASDDDGGGGNHPTNPSGKP